jgi:toxin ParE1/3/4
VKLRFTPSARTQLLDAVGYIAVRRPAAARAFFERVHQRLQALESYPESGRVVPEFPDLPFREVLVPPYRLFYLQRGKHVWVVGVWHDAQLPEEPTAQ